MMKKFFLYTFALVFGGVVLTSCDDDERMPSYEVLTFEEPSWANYIDSKQYGGSLLYGTGTGYTEEDFEAGKVYNWKDQNTMLSSTLTFGWGSYCYWNGGIAVSNYIDSNIEEHKDFDYQLAVPKSNGSKNFAVVYCEASMTFADKVAREIASMDVSPTTFQLGVTTYGDDKAKSLAKEGELVLHITGIMPNDSEQELTTVYLAKNGTLLTDWVTINVCPAGVKVKGLKFTMTGSDASDWGGINTPTYFAFDNVKVLGE